MSQKAAYELTITEKLEQLSVPDMVDAIWSRIETQLDLDLPTDDGPPQPPSSPVNGSGAWLGSLFIAALISAIYFLNIKPSQPGGNEATGTPSPVIVSPPGNNIDRPPPATGASPPSTNTPSQNLSTGSLPGRDSSAATDSLLTAQDLVIDSGQGQPVVTPQVLPVTGATDSIKRKGRGVRGINDSDYRIVPTKEN